jgi:riboflavin kinase/FMN adenylyltransferase
MQVWWDPEKWRQEQLQKAGPLALTIGNFDGVHLGHQELLKTTVEKAKAMQGYSLLLTFHPHPAEFLHPEKKHVRLFTLEDQQAQLQKLGLNGVLRQPFSRAFSELTAAQFLQDYMMKYFQPKAVVIGHDFHFGAHRQGDFKMLQSFCADQKIDLKMIPAKQIDGEVVSTSKIRQSLLRGELRLAEKMLGRPYYLKGIVEKGEARGRLLGFPTANIKPDVDFYPRMGVYVCEVTQSLKPNVKRRAVMNVGLNRTFVEGDHQPIKAEVHLLDFAEDLYGQTLHVELCEYLREEKKFPSLDELKKQIALDAQTAREWVRR